ncbi:MAG: polymerase [Thermomicrobiales bacterium]|jgi:DNA polymerase-1|nr:polymerase [Thermomicrobiales bacterium]
MRIAPTNGARTATLRRAMKSLKGSTLSTTGDQATTRPTIMLVDGYGLIFRAFHALQSTMSTSTGELTNAVFGFASMLLGVLNTQKPTHAIVALEGGRTFRHDAYEGYKANRAAMPDDLRSQVVRIRQLIDALNVPIEERDGYEADDVIGSLAARCSREFGLHVVIVTGDTDLLQLVDDNVEVVLPGARRFEDLRRFDRAAVVERYGFGPEHVPDYKALVGDTSDNIPGVPGIGGKTATALITRFGGVEEILQHLGEVTPPRAKAALEANAAQAIESKRLATIVCDLDVSCDLEHSSIQNYDRERVVALFRELEFRTLLNRLPEPQRIAERQAKVEREPSTRTIVRTRDELDRLIGRIRETGSYAIDVESTSTDPMQARLVGIAIAVSPSEGYYIPVGHAAGNQLSMDEVRDALTPVLSDPALEVLAHHAKYDLQVLRRHRFPIERATFDTMIAAYLLNESSVGLKDLAFTKLGIEMTEITRLIGTGRGQLTMDVVSLEEAGDYAAGDVEATFELAEHFRPLLTAQGQDRLFAEIEMPLVPVLVEMERAGIAIDAGYLQELANEIQNRMRELEREIYECAGREFNVNSTKQLASLLFEELKLPSGRRTKTGYSVDQDVLEGLRAEHRIVQLILEYRSLGKLQSTYVEALPLQVNPETGRIHTSFNQTIAATGRLSSTNPNLQNIPIRTELGRRVRRAFVADHRPESRLFKNATLLSIDYSQIELRLLAHLTQEPFLLDAFRSGEDVHRATAALVYGVEPSEVTPDMRRVAKTVNFGLLYGMQAYGLSRDTGLSRAEAQKFIDQYWARLPNVKRYFDETLRMGATRGYVETLNGRRRLLPDLQASNGARRAAAERMAINMPVQGTAADIMKLAMIRLAERLDESDLRARLLLQVHDELVLEVDRPDLEATARLVVETMENAYDLTVPLETDVSYGQNWEEMTPLSA